MKPEDLKYKWSKIFAAKRYPNNEKIKLDTKEQQELLDDIMKIDTDQEMYNEAKQEIGKKQNLIDICRMALEEIINKETDPITAAGGALLFLNSKKPGKETIEWAEGVIEEYKKLKVEKPVEVRMTNEEYKLYCQRSVL